MTSSNIYGYYRKDLKNMKIRTWPLYVAQRLSGINETNTEFKTLEIVKDDVNKDIDPGVDTYYKNGIIHHPTRNVIAAIVNMDYNTEEVACVVSIKNCKDVPIIMFYSDKFPAQFSKEYEQYVFQKCIDVYPKFKDILDSAIYTEGHRFYDYKGNEHSLEEFMAAPEIGIYSLYEYDIVDSLPEGWSLKYSDGAKERLEALYESV